MRRGSVTVEYVLILPLLALLIFGALDLARAVMLKHAATVAACQAARYLSLDPWDEATAIALARAEAGSVLGNGAEVAIEFSFSEPDRCFGSLVGTEVRIEYHSLIPFMSSADITLLGQCVLLVEAWP